MCSSVYQSNDSNSSKTLGSLQITESGDDAATVTLADGRAVHAKLVVGADGNASNARKYIQVRASCVPSITSSCGLTSYHVQ